MRTRFPFATALATLFVASGCGATSFEAAGPARFDVDNAKEVDDGDVAKAFAAHPRLPATVRVATYAFDDAHDEEIARSLGAVPGVESVYRIPKLLVTGQRRYAVNSPYAAPTEVGIKKLRLLAARAHADVLVVFDDGYRGGGANGWAALNILLVPALFTPWLSNETETYAQAYVVDVRNGYLYGEVSAEMNGGDGAVTIYSKGVDQVAKDLWPELLTQVKEKVGATLAEGRRASASGEAARGGE